MRTLREREREREEKKSFERWRMMVEEIYDGWKLRILLGTLF